MFRAMLTISMLTLWYCFITVQGGPAPEPSPAPAPEPSPKGSSYLSIDEDDEMPVLEDYRTKPLGELRTVLSTIKEQFREIIEDLMAQVLSYFIEILAQIKVRLLKKLARYSLSDVLEVIFDGFTDFIIEPVPDYYETTRKPVSSSYGYRPFSLASLFAKNM